jgi:hypothetical protein
LEKKAEQVLPGSDRGSESEGGSRRHWGEIAQRMYAHVNKLIKKLKKNEMGSQGWWSCSCGRALA